MDVVIGAAISLLISLIFYRLASRDLRKAVMELRKETDDLKTASAELRAETENIRRITRNAGVTTQALTSALQEISMGKVIVYYLHEEDGTISGLASMTRTEFAEFQQKNRAKQAVGQTIVG